MPDVLDRWSERQPMAEGGTVVDFQDGLGDLGVPGVSGKVPASKADADYVAVASGDQAFVLHAERVEEVDFVLVAVGEAKSAEHAQALSADAIVISASGFLLAVRLIIT